MTAALSYKFGYSDDTATPKGWGELNKVRLPTRTMTPSEQDDASVAYAFEYDGRSFVKSEFDILANPVTQKGITHDGTTETTSYSFTRTGPTPNSQIIAPDNAVTKMWFYEPDDGASWKRGLVYKIQEPSGDMVEREWARNQPYEHTVASDPGNPFVKTEIRSIHNGTSLARTTATTFDYDKNGNLRERIEYDWTAYNGPYVNPYSGLPSGATARRTTLQSYYNPTDLSANTTSNPTYAYWNPSSPRVRNALARTEVRDGWKTAPQKAVTDLVYDNASTTANVTQTWRWDSVKQASEPGSGPLSASNAVVKKATYDGFGNVIITEDERGHRTKLSYGQICPSCTGIDNLYPTQIEEAYLDGSERTTTFIYDYSSGRPVTETDADNGIVTNRIYDTFGRLTEVAEAWLRKTTTAYDDAQRKVTVKSDLRTWGDGLLQAATHYDQLGRVRLTRTSDGSALNPFGENDGIKVQTKYITASGNTCQLTTNPYRSPSDPTYGWARTRFDQAGRVVETARFNAEPSNCWTTNGRNGWTTISYGADSNGRLETVIENGFDGQKKSERYFDSFGRLIKVTEYPGAGSYNTTHAYDPMDNLKTVIQGGQTRTFAHSSLSRLLSATNPESGTTSYTYYDDGLLHTKTDARGMSSTSTYNARHQILSRTFSGDGGVTPAESYQYGTTAPNFGRLVQIFNGTTSSFGYDALGRVAASSQYTAGQLYTFAYSYFLDGTLQTMQYPSGKTITYTVDDAGRFVTAGAGGATYASSASYAPHGALAELRFGNNRWEYRDYNNRLQAADIGLGTNQGGSDLFRLLYTYGSSINNGNVQTQRMMTPGFDRTQTYVYDGVNRLTSASESGGAWSRTYDYDAYGNRRVSASSLVLSPLTPASASAFGSLTNRVQGGLWLHDAAGNITRDALGRQMGYDADNRMISFTDASLASRNRTYAYDGQGRRTLATQISSGDRTVYVYDAFGRLAAEYADNLLTGNGVEYRMTDHLGSTRATMNATGAIKSYLDMTPFGEQLGAGIGGRPATYGASNSFAQKFTAKERDDESGLDYFGARYMGSSLGRFTSPDVPLLDQSPADPQSWNLYGYVRNNPLVFIDPSGRSTVVAADGTVIDAEDDDDTNVYLVYAQVTFDPVAFVNSGGSGGVSAQSGRFKVGETEFADEFVAFNSETGELTGGVAEGPRILFGESFDADITGLNAESNALALGLASTALESAIGGRFDIKLNTAIAPFGSNTGKLLGGKYATARSAGNYLAGLNAATGTFAGSQITFSTMSRLAGALHHGGRVGVARALLGADLGREIPQSQRRIEQGFRAGRGVAVGPLR